MKMPIEEKIFLLADDDQDDTELFQEALASIDPAITFHSAGDGQEALHKLELLDQKPDIIFLDINMPVMNGWQCLKQIKSCEAYKDIPVVIYSTSSYQREMNIALNLGAMCYLIKPDDFIVLKEALSVIVTNLDNNLADAIEAFNQSRTTKLFQCFG
jgi:CheY-like chemotaxis protein